MIKVTYREKVYLENGITKDEIKTREHSKGKHAHVYNGVLTVYDTKPEENSDLKFGIAGYMPDTWLFWEHQEVA